MGQKILICFFIFIIGFGVVYALTTRGKLLGITFFQKHETSTLGSSTSVTPIPTSNQVPTQTPTSTQSIGTNSKQEPTPSSIYPTVPLTPIPSPEGVSSGQSSSFDFSTFKYPNSLITAKTDSAMDLESTDDPNAISNWFQNQISNIGFHATSVVTTNTNGNVLDKLTASNNDKQVKITISKNAGNDPTVKIQVEI